MLVHQLPKLPRFESLRAVMPEFFSWLASGISDRVMEDQAVNAGSPGTIDLAFTAALAIGSPSRR
jgi:hypothetical protein